MLNKQTRKLLLLASTCAVTMLITQAAVADIKVRAGISKVSYSTDMAAPTRTFSGSHDFRVPLIGATFISDTGWYVDAALATVNTPSNIYTDGTLTRKDGTVVVGKSETGDTGTSKSWYVGMKFGTTDQDEQPVGGNRSEYSMNTTGLVFGGGFGIPLSVGGTVAMNAGLGIMQMQWREKYNGIFRSENRSGFSPGYSYGLSYNYPFNQTIGAVAEYKGQVYNYSFNGGGSGPTKPSSVSEKVTTISLSLYATF
jgi:hypothetical protein